MPKKLSPEELAAKEERAKLKAERDEARAKIKAEKEAAKAAKESANSGEATVAPAEPEAPKVVKFEGATVLEILTTKHTATHFHCRLSDGTSKHVPKELFE